MQLLQAGIDVSGFDAVIEGDVPLGGGMSSSAAIEVATVQICQFFSQDAFTVAPTGGTLTPMQVAELCQHAEWSASGVRCGIMDQAASCLGRPEHAVLLDCRSLAYRYLPFHAPGFSLVLIDTGVRHDLASTAYNERRQQCSQGSHIGRESMAEVVVSLPTLSHNASRRASLHESRRRANFPAPRASAKPPSSRRWTGRVTG